MKNKQQYREKKIKNNLSREQNQTLLKFAKMQTKSIFKELKTSEEGLKLKNIETLHEKHGYNTFSTKKKHNI